MSSLRYCFALTLIPVIALSVTLPTVASAASPPAELKQAIDRYNARDYATAIALLAKVSAKNSNNPYTHYYRALSFQAVGRTADAEREYRWNYEHRCDADLAYKSWQGLNGLGARGTVLNHSVSAEKQSAVAATRDNTMLTADSLGIKGDGVVPLNFKMKVKNGCFHNW